MKSSIIELNYFANYIILWRILWMLPMPQKKNHMSLFFLPCHCLYKCRVGVFINFVGETSVFLKHSTEATPRVQRFKFLVSLICSIYCSTQRTQLCSLFMCQVTMLLWSYIFCFHQLLTKKKRWFVALTGVEGQVWSSVTSHSNTFSVA